MKVIIAGGREVRDFELVSGAIEASGFNISEVVSGAASGVDQLGEAWAKQRNIPVKLFPAEWKKHGFSAGPIRNRKMVRYADAAIAIPTGGPGTEDLIRAARQHKLPIYIHRNSK